MLVAFPITIVVAFQSFNGMRITTPPIVSPNSKLSRGLSRVSIACARRGQRRPHSALAYQPSGARGQTPQTSDLGCLAAIRCRMKAATGISPKLTLRDVPP